MKDNIYRLCLYIDNCNHDNGYKNAQWIPRTKDIL
jgi:hypothetical protein